MTGRAHLVTGSTGIGAAAAQQLVGAQERVFVVSRTAAHTSTLLAQLAQLAEPERAGSFAADLTLEEAADGAVAAAVERFGRIDGLLSVAGGSGRGFGDGPIHELTAEGWDRTIELNLRSQALVSRAVVRRMLEQPRNDLGERGAIVLVSSVLAAHPVPGLFATHAYAAAKGGIVALATAMAATYADAGIRVNVVAPGLTDTPMAERAAADAATVAFARRKQPLTAGMVDPADVARAACFLLSPAARAITGQVVAVDGGWSVVSAVPE